MVLRSLLGCRGERLVRLDTFVEISDTVAKHRAIFQSRHEQYGAIKNTLTCEGPTDP